MVVESSFRGVIHFMDDLGIYDVVLPFLLVFTIVFAILEKSKIFGTEEFEGKAYTKKNLNSMVAFVMAFLVVASTRLVAVINQAIANIVLLLILIVMFLMLIGSFFKESEDVFLKGGWRTAFMAAVLIAIILIFLDALDWLEVVIAFVERNIATAWFESLVLIGFVALFMWLITKNSHKPTKKPSEED
ncbi:MAG: hypothetical protein GXP63_05890 [DPANN group archaeon]|nr:hypothetical protein [DPANN group archaeon]